MVEGWFQTFMIKIVSVLNLEIAKVFFLSIILNFIKKIELFYYFKLFLNNIF